MNRHESTGGGLLIHGRAAHRETLVGFGWSHATESRPILTHKMIDLPALLEKSADADLLREMIGFTHLALRDATHRHARARLPTERVKTPWIGRARRSTAGARCWARISALESGSFWVRVSKQAGPSCRALRQARDRDSHEELKSDCQGYSTRPGSAAGGAVEEAI